MDKNFRIMFLRNSNNHPVGCIAMHIANDSVKYQVSTLNPVDKFNRRVARQLALGRLLENPYTVSSPVNGIHDTVRAVMNDITSNKMITNRARIAAAKWLTSSNKNVTFEQE